MQFQFLFNHGANIDIEDNQQRTCLDIAIASENTDIVHFTLNLVTQLDGFFVFNLLI